MAALTATVAQTVPLTTQSAAANIYYGDVDQAIAAVTQAGTGETDFFTATSVMTLDGTVLLSYTNTETTYITMSEEVQYIEERTATTAFTLDDTVEYWSTVTAVGSMTMSSAVTNVEWTHTAPPTVFTMGDEVTTTITIPLLTSFTLDDSVEISRTTSTTDYMTMTEEATASTTAAETVTSTFTMSDSAETGQAETAISSFTLDGTVPSNEVVANLEVSDSMTLDDETTAVVHTFEDLLSSMTMTEVITFNGSVSNTTVSDSMYLKDTIWARDFNAIAWVMNTETGGLSSYDNFEYYSIAEYDGDLYATSPEGVFKLTGDDDEGRDIDTELQTGFLDLGSEQTKRISDLYTGYTGGPLQCEVETYDGPQEVYTYDMEERDADAPRNNRIKVGRGLSSRYWRFNFKNIDGANFQVYDLSAVVGTSKRRL